MLLSPVWPFVEKDSPFTHHLARKEQHSRISASSALILTLFLASEENYDLTHSRPAFSPPQKRKEVSSISRTHSRRGILTELCSLPTLPKNIYQESVKRHWGFVNYL